jgi:hypothetical protein
MRDPKLDENHYILSPLPRVSARWARAGECHFWVIRVALGTLAERRSSPNSDQTGDPPGQSKGASSGRTDSHYRTSAEPRGALLPQLDDDLSRSRWHGRGMVVNDQPTLTVLDVGEAVARGRAQLIERQRTSNAARRSFSVSEPA